MKRYTGSIAACVLVALFTLTVGPAMAAAPRSDRGREVPAPIVRLIKQFKKVFGIGPQDNLPIPPRPEPVPPTTP